MQRRRRRRHGLHDGGRNVPDCARQPRRCGYGKVVSGRRRRRDDADCRARDGAAPCVDAGVRGVGGCRDRCRGRRCRRRRGFASGGACSVCGGAACAASGRFVDRRGGRCAVSVALRRWRRWPDAGRRRRRRDAEGAADGGARADDRCRRAAANVVPQAADVVCVAHAWHRHRRRERGQRRRRRQRRRPRRPARLQRANAPRVVGSKLGDARAAARAVDAQPQQQGLARPHRSRRRRCPRRCGVGQGEGQGAPRVASVARCEELALLASRPHQRRRVHLRRHRPPQRGRAAPPPRLRRAASADGRAVARRCRRRQRRGQGSRGCQRAAAAQPQQRRRARLV